MKILVLNCGSSSIKYQVIDMKSTTEYTLLGKGIVERIGLSDAILTHKPVGKPVYEIVRGIPDHTCGINLILDALVDPEHGVLENLTEIAAVGHRVVHGGEYFKESALIDKEVKQKIEACFDLAPLHNPANLKGILAMEHILPGTPQVAVFDTSFHQTMPPKSFMYALPYKYYEDYKVRRYGFHGTSHRYVAEKACELFDVDMKHSKIVTCHIGSGASVTAILNGKSYDTSMGFTPVDGLIMGTRSGDIDPAFVEYLCNKENLTVSEVLNILNKKSGMEGLTGGKSDFRDLEEGYEAGDQACIDAIEVFCYNVARFVGAYAASLNGVDVIAFTAGIGENSGFVRGKICEYLGYLGITIDAEQNSKRGEDIIISTPDSKVTVCVIPTNEELMIARDTKALVEAQ